VQELTATTVCEGVLFPEGPRWRGDRLWFSDILGGAVRTVTPAGVLETAAEIEHPSGLGWLPDGRLLVVGMDDRVLWRIEPDGGRAVHADLTGLARAACNDMVVDGNGNAYLGAYDLAIGERAEDMAQGKVVLVRPTGEAVVVADRMKFPNGMVVTPDGSTLIVGESGAFALVAFPIRPDGTLGERRTFAQLEHPPDGICLDAAGGVWAADPLGDGAYRYEDGGARTHHVAAGRSTLAVALGGEGRRTLFLATVQSHSFAEAREQKAGWIQACPVEVGGAGWP
jgi:sugar lactone lactonase YvrE